MTYQVFPDVEAMVAYAIREAAITNLGDRVYSSVPREPAWPLVTVKRIGGLPVERHRLDLARIQVEAWGGTKSQAHDIAQEARAVIHRREGTDFDASAGAPVDGFWTAVEDDLGLTWQPDPTTSRDRYLFGVAITCHI